MGGGVVEDDFVDESSLCQIPPSKTRRKTRRRKSELLRENILLLFTIFSVFAGFGIGFGLRHLHPSQRAIDLIGFPGEIFMNILKAMILPLIAASLVSGLSQLDAKQSGWIGLFAFIYYSVTMFLAVTTGICLVLLIHPGDPSIKEQYGELDNTAADVSALDKMTDVLRNMFPDNIVRASFQQIETEYVDKNVTHPQLGTFTIVTSAVHKYVDGMNALGLIVFFIALGLVMGQLGDEAKPLADLFISLDKVIIALVSIVMWYSPIGIASLIAAKILEITDLAKTARMLALYMLTVTTGLLIHLFITLPALLFIATRRNPYKFMQGLTQAALTALGTASSAASLPVTFKCLEEINGVLPKYTKFVLPVGAMVNMDGTALYEAVASVFIAQMNGLEMNPGTVVTIALTATLASMGAASIPSAGLVTMLIVLTAVGLPASDVTLIIAVDWLLDRLRTSVNVIGDGIGCGFVEAMVEKRFKSSKTITPTDCWAIGGEKKVRVKMNGKSEKIYHYRKIN
uniref:Amino acid transporter n=1 Tax=Meloidogyne hapla TaxID=6305 RepID=A0A1I8BEE6_MELHA